MTETANTTETTITEEDEVEITVRIELAADAAVGEALAALCQRHGAPVSEVIDHTEDAPVLYLVMTGTSREELESQVDLATRWDAAVVAWEVVS